MNIIQMRIILTLPLLTTVIQNLNGNINVNINTDRVYFSYPLKEVSSTEMDYEERAVELKGRSQSSDYSYDDQDDKCVTNGGKQIGVKCVFPFIYHGTEYNGCTSIDHHAPWCATTVNLPGNMDMWGSCPSSCKLYSADGKCVTDGGKQIGVKCVFPFIYHGTEYNGCISNDHHAPWCATTVNLPGNMDMWGNCPSSCKLHSAGTDGDDNYTYVGNKISGSGNNNVGDNNGNSYKTECILGMIPSSDYNGNCQCFCGGDWEKTLAKENVVAIKKITKN